MRFRHSTRRFPWGVLILFLAAGVATLSGQQIDSPSTPAQEPADERLQADLVKLLENQEYDRAIAVARQLAAARERSGKADARLAEGLLWLAEAEAGAGHVAEAAAAYEKAADAAAAAFGPMHAELAVSLNELGIFRFGCGDYPAALPVFERALRIREQASGADAAETAAVVNNLARSCRNRESTPRLSPSSLARDLPCASGRRDD